MLAKCQHGNQRLDSPCKTRLSGAFWNGIDRDGSPGLYVSSFSLFKDIIENLINVIIWKVFSASNGRFRLAEETIPGSSNDNLTN